jgi:uncharacterized spore protein YtfJ
MVVEELIEEARQAVAGKRAYGEPYEKDDVAVIPAATVRGGAGGGGGEESERKGGGGGFGLTAKPVGAWVIKDGQVTWKPAVDVNRIVLGGQIVALAAILTLGRIVVAHMRR